MRPECLSRITPDQDTTVRYRCKHCGKCKNCQFVKQNRPCSDCLPVSIPAAGLFLALLQLLRVLPYMRRLLLSQQLHSLMLTVSSPVAAAITASLGSSTASPSSTSSHLTTSQSTASAFTGSCPPLFWRPLSGLYFRFKVCTLHHVPKPGV